MWYMLPWCRKLVSVNRNICLVVTVVMNLSMAGMKIKPSNSCAKTATNLIKYEMQFLLFSDIGGALVTE